MRNERVWRGVELKLKEALKGTVRTCLQVSLTMVLTQLKKQHHLPGKNQLVYGIHHDLGVVEQEGDGGQSLLDFFLEGC